MLQSTTIPFKSKESIRKVDSEVDEIWKHVISSCALQVTQRAQVRSFRKGSLCVSVKTRKVPHSHSLRFPLTCVKVPKGIIDYLVITR